MPELVVWTGKQFIVVGASHESQGIYDPSTDTWRAMMPPPIEPIWHLAAWDGCRVLLQSAVGFYAYEPPPDL
jgi:hypothetical protein